MSELESLCHALEDSVQALPSIVSTFHQRAARLRSLAAQVEQAARQVDNEPNVGQVVRELHEAASAMSASSSSLTVAIQQSRSFVERTIRAGEGPAADVAGAVSPVPLAGAADAGQWPGAQFGLSQSPTASGGVNLLPLGDLAGQMASELQGAPGFTDVVIHGNEFEVGTYDGPSMTADDLGSVIGATPQLAGRSIRLFACSSGQLDDGLAQQLADRIGQTVAAPTDLVQLTGRPGNVRMVVGPNPYTNSGTWRIFHPRV